MLPSVGVPCDLSSLLSRADIYGSAGTTFVHGNQFPDPRTGAVVPAISLATTFAQSSPGVPRGADDATSFGRGFDYSRTGNPTRGALELALTAAETGACHTVCFSSGCAAVSATLHATLKTGDEALCIDDVYGGTQRLFRQVAATTYGMNITFVDFAVENALETRLIEGGGKVKLVWLETPTNPLLKISDIRQAADLAHKHNALLAVDSTFMSPFLQNPLTLGADLVVHSITKYIGGHSDVVMGCVCVSSPELYKSLRFVQNSLGAVPSPFDCFLALRGLKTLHLRMEASSRSALALASYLESHPQVLSVLYPGLQSHPQHSLSLRQQRGPGAMITFYLKGGLPSASAFLTSLSVFALAESLGAVESLAEAPASMTHASVPAEVRRKLGVDDGLVRLSIGVEGVRDLLKDLETALDKAREAEEMALKADEPDDKGGGC